MSVSRSPIAPLRPIDAAEIAVFICPLVPNRDAMLVEKFDIGIASEEPEQFVEDGFQVQFLGGQRRKSCGERKPGLRTENRIGSRARAIRFEFTLVQNVAQAPGLCP